LTRPEHRGPGPAASTQPSLGLGGKIGNRDNSNCFCDVAYEEVLRNRRAGESIAAIGVGVAPGGDLDEACAKAGIDKISARLK